MDILDSPDVRRVVDVDPHLERTAEHVADVVQFVVVGAKVDSLVGIDQRDVDDAAVHPPPLDGPGKWLDRRGVLFGIDDRDPSHRRTLLEVDERWTVLFTGVSRGKNDRAVFCVGVVRGLPFSRKAHAGGNHQVVIDPVEALGHLDDTAPVLACGVQSPLNCR